MRHTSFFVTSHFLISHSLNSEALGYNAIFLTVDAPVPGNRERDVRAPFELDEQEKEVVESVAGKEGAAEKNHGEMPKAPADVNALENDDDKEVGGTAAALLKNDDVDMTWEKVICMAAVRRWLLTVPLKRPSLGCDWSPNSRSC